MSAMGRTDVGALLNNIERLSPNFKKQLSKLPDIEGMKRGGRVGYAVGGSIGAPATVGLGSFGGGATTGGTSVGTGMGDPFGGGYGLGGDPKPQPVAAPAAAPDTSQMTPAEAAQYSGLWSNLYGGYTLGGALPDVDPNSKAPIYDLTPEGGGYMNPIFQATLHAAGAGGITMPGVAAFLGGDYTPYKAIPGESHGQGIDAWKDPDKMEYDPTELVNLAKAIGYDTSKYNLNPNAQGTTTPGNGLTLAQGSLGTSTTENGIMQLYKDLNDQTKDYVGIKGLSAGWNMQPNGDMRGRDTVLYKNVNGKLTPVSTGGAAHDSAPRTGGWIRQNPLAFQALLAAGAILTGGLAAGAAGAAGAGAAEAGAAGGGAAATGAGSGAAATGAGAAAAESGSLASMYAGLPAWGQGALQGAATGAISSGLQGGNIIKGALTGAVTGGVGGGVGSALSDAGAGSTLSSLGGKGASFLTGQGIKNYFTQPQTAQPQATRTSYTQPAQSQIPASQGALAQTQAPAQSDSGVLSSKYFSQFG
jgi:hypothetical protein